MPKKSLPFTTSEKKQPRPRQLIRFQFWNRRPLRVSDSEPAVRLAIMTVGSLFEHVQHEASGSPENDGQALITGRVTKFKTQYYNNL
jgi:hypothetical protein